jgi:hypothetical protein
MCQEAIDVGHGRLPFWLLISAPLEGRVFGFRLQ